MPWPILTGSRMRCLRQQQNRQRLLPGPVWCPDRSHGLTFHVFSGACPSSRAETCLELHKHRDSSINSEPGDFQLLSLSRDSQQHFRGQRPVFWLPMRLALATVDAMTTDRTRPLRLILSVIVLIISLVVQAPAMALSSHPANLPFAARFMSKDLNATAKDAEGRLEAAHGDLTGDTGEKIKGQAKQVQASPCRRDPISSKDSSLPSANSVKPHQTLQTRCDDLSMKA